MARIVAVTSCPTGIAHTFMAAEGLRRGAEAEGHQIDVETQGSVGTQDTLSSAAIQAADVVIIAADTNVDKSRFAGKSVYEVGAKAAIADGAAVVRQALASAGAAAPVAGSPTGTQKIVAITSCPTGIAHTFMAAEGVEKGAQSLGYQVKVETQGSVGAQNTLTAQDIAQADVVIIAADTNVDLSRFTGKRVYSTNTKAAIHDGAALVKKAVAEAKIHGASGAPAAGGDYAASVAAMKAQSSANRTGPYKHLMTGVSYMLPFVVAGGLLIALAFAFGGIYAGNPENKGQLGWALMQIGGSSAFALMVPILAGFIAYSIADRPGLAPGMIGGMLAASTGAGFLGGIVAGFIAGYSTQWLNRVIKLPRTLEGIKPVLVLPLLGTAIVGLLMIYVIGTPVSAALNALTTWLQGMQSSSALVLGLILGAMMAFDMGGPVNKASYAFAVGLLGSNVFAPMAAVMAAGMVPPLGLALAATLFKNRFTADEQEASKAAAVLGISFITEGAIPFAARDPLRVIPSIMLGSAVTGALSMVFGCELRAPHGGVFVLPIPNAVTNLGMYIVAILVGTVVTAAALFILKRPIVAAPAVAEPQTTTSAQAVQV